VTRACRGAAGDQLILRRLVREWWWVNGNGVATSGASSQDFRAGKTGSGAAESARERAVLVRKKDWPSLLSSALHAGLVIGGR
jgi:hypothetical protein